MDQFGAWHAKTLEAAVQGLVKCLEAVIRAVFERVRRGACTGREAIDRAAEQVSRGTRTDPLPGVEHGRWFPP